MLPRAATPLALPILLIAIVAFPAPAAESASTAASIVGTVRVAVGEAPDPPMLSPYARRRYRPPTPSAPSPGSPSNVVVYVELAEGSAPTASPPAEATIEQRGRAIVPHVTAVQRGATIHFPNRDDVFHNLFSLSDTHRFNLGRYPPGESRSERFPRAGVVRMFCDIHSEMAGTILVLDTPFFARPDASGAFRIDGVPAGRHRVIAWHDASVADTAYVTVGAAGSAQVDFDLSD
ncbi:MAG TPA: carboxypeptidase regulatory-like domain-containing protein [Longimicrobiales bacterium]